jgi:hypothetical protein
MIRRVSNPGLLLGLTGTALAACLCGALGAAKAQNKSAIPDFAPDVSTGWVLDRTVDENANYLQQYSAPMPTAEKPDF